MQTQSNNVITCKVAFQAEIRRFTLERAEYSVLRDQLCALFPQLSKETMVIRYTDDEKDLVTISSDEELNVALKVSNNFLRLSVGPKATESNDAPCRSWRGPGPYCNNNPRWEKKFNKKFGKRCDPSSPEFAQARIARLTHVQEKLKARLAHLESLPPTEDGTRPRHQEKLRRKLAYISAILEKFTSDAENGVTPATEGPCSQGFNRPWRGQHHGGSFHHHGPHHGGPHHHGPHHHHYGQPFGHARGGPHHGFPRGAPHHFGPHPAFAGEAPVPVPQPEQNVNPQDAAELRRQIDESLNELKAARTRLKNMESSESESSSSSEDSNEERKKAKADIRARIQELKKLRKQLKETGPMGEQARAAKQEVRLAKQEARAAKHAACQAKREARAAHRAAKLAKRGMRFEEQTKDAQLPKHM